MVTSRMAFYKQELLPERRDFNWNSFRIRRGKRLGRITKRKCSVWVSLPALVFLVFFCFFSRTLTSHNSLLIKEELSERDANALLNTPKLWLQNVYNITSTDTERVKSTGRLEDENQFQLDVQKRQKSKHRKQYGPCEIDFMQSINDLKEPKNYTNITHFSLEYVTKEERVDEYGLLHSRFGGYQTLKEREMSFHARSQTLHCGFVKGPEEAGGTGFDLDEDDKSYMLTCKVVVSSCIFGSSDFLRKPTNRKVLFSRNAIFPHRKWLYMLATYQNQKTYILGFAHKSIHVSLDMLVHIEVSEYSKKNICFVMFLDQLTMEKLSSEGHVRDDRGYIGLWRIVLVKNLPYKDMRKVGKVPKFLSHRLFPSSWYSIWIDSKMRLNVDPMLILEYFLWRRQAEYAISNHYDRHCVWEEVLQNKRLNKYNHTAIDEQFTLYQFDGLTKFNESDENTLLPSYVPEGSFIVRAHTPMSNLFSCLWFNEVDRFTSRDQLSFAYTYLKLRRENPERPFFLNMFKDCERRALAKLFHHRTENTPPFSAG